MVAKRLIDKIHQTATEPVKFMEVCGTHTVAIARNGLREVMPETITLLSGPGCPVCVTANRDIGVVTDKGRKITFKMVTKGGEDGFDFRLNKDATVVIFDLRFDEGCAIRAAEAGSGRSRRSAAKFHSSLGI